MYYNYIYICSRVLLHRSGEQSRDRGTVCKEQRATSYLYVDEHVTMTLLLTSSSNHTMSLQNTLPPQAGRGQPKRPQAPLHMGGGDEAKQDQTRKATRPNKTTTHLTGKGGYHGVGGRGGVAALHQIYIYIYRERERKSSYIRCG